MAVPNMFTKAVKRQAKLRLDVNGPSGSGKTYTALAVGAELAAKDGKRMAVIDTEHGSAAKYSNIFDFDVVELSAPYNPGRYVELIEMAQAAGYGVLVIDSLTHAWVGTGGVLEMVEQIAKEKAAKFKGAVDTYAAWNDGKKIQAKFIESILSSDIHIIATMRSKQEHERQVENGKTRIVKLGMAPIQADNMDYEFDIVLDMDESHQGFVSKGRCPDVDGKIYPKPGKQFATEVMAWLDGAKPLERTVPPVIEKPKFVPAVKAESTEPVTAPLGEMRDPEAIMAGFKASMDLDEVEASAEEVAAAWAAIKELAGDKTKYKPLAAKVGVETLTGLKRNTANLFVAWNGMAFGKAEAAAVLAA